MKYTFIGDIHGKVDAVKRALDKEGQKIFVGDFIDSFDHSVRDHGECFELVLNAIKQGTAQAIFGNHELSYLKPSVHKCSGWSIERAGLMLEYGKEIETHFKPFICLEDNLLVSHAGITNQLWERFELTLDLLPQILAEWWPDLRSPMHYVGFKRGGPDQVGGPFWCDFRTEFEPVKGLNQIFGHTAGKEIQVIKTDTESSYCIDCLDHCTDFLELDFGDGNVVVA